MEDARLAIRDSKKQNLFTLQQFLLRLRQGERECLFASMIVFAYFVSVAKPGCDVENAQ